MPKYYVLSDVMGITTRVELTGPEHAKYLRAWRIITACLAIEESFRHVVADMVDLEAAIHRHSLEAICTPHSEWSLMMDRLHDLSRHVTHLLGTSEAYLDSTERHLKPAFGRTHPVVQQWQKLRDAYRNDNVEAQLWHAMRNTAHHEGQALSGISVRARRAGPSAAHAAHIEHTLLLLISDELSQQHGRRGQHSRPTGTHAQKGGAALAADNDIRSLSHKHISTLGAAHNELRAAIGPHHQQAVALVDEAIGRFAEACGKPPESVYAMLAATAADGTVSEKTPLHRQWSMRYAMLKQRNTGVANLRRSVIATRQPESTA